MTDAELDQPATRRDLFDTRDQLRNELRQDMIAMRVELRHEIEAVRDELRRHFDVVAEQFRADFGNLFDWTRGTTSTLGARIDDLDARVTRLGQPTKP